MTAPIRVGIIGTGGMANWHARQLLAQQCVVGAVCDVDAARADAFAQRYGAAHVSSDYRQLIERGEIEAVCVVTPNDLHAPVALAAIEAGLHVLCEKPLALNERDAATMLGAARDHGVIHVVNFTHRNTPCFTLARTLLAGGHIGAIYHAQATYLQDWLLRRNRQPSPGPPPWRLDKSVAGSGQLGDLGSHLLDLLHGMVGDVASVSASLPSFPNLHGDTPAANVSDDVAALQLDFATGGVGQLLASRVATGLGDNVVVQIYGSEGALIADDLQRGELRACLGKAGVERRAWTTFTIGEPEHEPNPLQLFVDGIRSGTQPPMGFDDGLWTQRIMDAAQRSAQSGTRQGLL
ncbi:MAG: Gfo/Idh/MocA family oxidoreductase [Chloroflexales bacterium]|nr:Gfo/Idh/MocA family oxidoreductase [Chloroflexales bacterium]